MKKTLSMICVIFAIIMFFLFWNLRQVQAQNRDVQSFNSSYEFYNRDNLCGVDITTIINKATDNNEKYAVKKDENNYYIPNNENSIKIYIKLINSTQAYPMEKFRELGLERFAEFFGPVTFKCTNVKYHEKTGRISEMTFLSLQS